MDPTLLRPKLAAMELQLSSSEDTRERAIERLKVLTRLSPYRLVQHAIQCALATGQGALGAGGVADAQPVAVPHQSPFQPVEINSFYDRFDCAALFIDISGFSKITEILFAAHGLEGAEELATHLNINLGKFVEKITKCGGDVIKFAGDAALCVFQAADAEDLAAKTLLATQLSLECIAEMESDNYVVEGVRLTAHSGIGCGSVTGFMAGGVFKRSEYAVIGEPIFQIASAEPAAGDGETVVSAQAYAQISNWVVGAETTDGNFLIKAVHPTHCVDTSGSALAALSGKFAGGNYFHEIEKLTMEQANLVAQQILPVVPGVVRNRLMEFGGNMIPNVSEFRHITVLFIRMVGMDYKKGVSELKRVQESVTLIQQLIYKHAGQLMRFSIDDKGAGVLGIFGLPPSHEDDPERGVACALDICKEVKEAFDITTNVGVTTGYCFSGLVGGVSRCEYTTHGPLVNLAARLMVASKNLMPYVDIATKNAAVLTSTKLQFTPLRSIKVKGREALVEIFVPSIKQQTRVLSRGKTALSALEEGGGDKGVTRSMSRRLSHKFSQKTMAYSEAEKKPMPSKKMLGRSQECELMRRIFLRFSLSAPESDGSDTDTDDEIEEMKQAEREKQRKHVGADQQCLLIEGEAAMGKTVLCGEAIHYARGLNLAVINTNGNKRMIGTPFAAFRSCMQNLLHEEMGGVAVTATDPDIFRRRIVSTLSQIFEKSPLGKDAHLLIGHVISDSQSGDVPSVMNDVHHLKLCALIKYWILRFCKMSPVLIVLDDAQWLDPSSWMLCEELLDGSTDNLLVIFSTRPLDEGDPCRRGMLRNSTEFLRRIRCPHITVPPMPKTDIRGVVGAHLAMHQYLSSDDYDFVKCAVHIGNLGGQWTEETKLIELCSRFGQVYAVTVRTRTNQTSWAIMHFARPLSVEHALKFEFAIGAKSMKFRGINEEQAMISTGAFATVWSLQKEKVAVARMESIYSTANNADHLEGQYKSNPEFETALWECQTGNPLAAMMIAESVVDGYFDASESLASPINSPGRKKGRSLVYEGADQNLVKSVRNMLNHLTQDEKELVKRAAMEGGTCSVDFLENLQTEVEGVASKFIKKIDTVATVHALLGKNVLRPDATISVSASDGLPPLHFRSRLVQEIAASNIGLVGSSEREHLHIALAQLSGDGRFTADELMAYHYGESGPNQQAKCLYHLELAADAALAMHADQEAEYLFGRLLMPGAGVETVTDDVHAKWLSSIAKARVRLRKGHTAKQECLHALELLDMPAPTSSAHCVDTSFQILLGREPLPEDAQEAEYGLLAELHHLLGQIALEEQDGALHGYSCLRSMQLAESGSSVLSPFDIARGYALLASALCQMGRPSMAGKWQNKSIDLVQSHTVWKHPKSKKEVITVRAILSDSMMDCGMWVQAQESWEIIMQLAKGEGDRASLELAMYKCGCIALRIHGIESAYRWFIQATQLVQLCDRLLLVKFLCSQALCEIHSKSHKTAEEALLMAEDALDKWRHNAESESISAAWLPSSNQTGAASPTTTNETKISGNWNRATSGATKLANAMQAFNVTRSEDWHRESDKELRFPQLKWQAMIQSLRALNNLWLGDELVAQDREAHRHFAALFFHVALELALDAAQKLVQLQQDCDLLQLEDFPAYQYSGMVLLQIWRDGNRNGLAPAAMAQLKLACFHICEASERFKHRFFPCAAAVDTMQGMYSLLSAERSGKARAEEAFSQAIATAEAAEPVLDPSSSVGGVLAHANALSTNQACSIDLGFALMQLGLLEHEFAGGGTTCQEPRCHSAEPVSFTVLKGATVE